MLSLTLGLYACSGLTIALLAAFAAHNRRTGWKRSHASVARAFEDAFTELGWSSDGGTAATPTESQRQTPFVAEDLADFSLQLVRMRAALGEANRVTIASGQARPERTEVPAYWGRE
jgi:hypothetical protein